MDNRCPPYRETIEELKSYQEEGVLTVDMEVAALSAVAKFRGVEFAAAFVISDLLGELEWNPQFGAPEVTNQFEKLALSVITILSQNEPS